MKKKKYKLPPIRYYTLAEVQLIIAEADTCWNTHHRGLALLLAFMYGTGTEISAALTLTKRDVDCNARTARVLGTKSRCRDRIVRVADWCWDQFAEYLATVDDPNRVLWPSFDRIRASKAHRLVVASIPNLPRYPLHNVRHHWAVTRLRAGWPIAAVQYQLGHARPTTTLERYGRFIPSGLDLDRYEALVTC